MPTRPPRARRAIASLFAAALPLLAFAPGCDSKMDPKQCDQIRGDAFDLVNKGQQCNSDADCEQSAWPGCAKPISKATGEKLKPMADKYKQGKCEEPKDDCKPPPEVYAAAG